jgi:hypothetical protein
MNGTDPSPQHVATENSLLTQHKVKVFLYNQQVTDSLTESFIKLAEENGIPVVGVYETMPTPGYDYQSWMLAEVSALDNAMTAKASTEHLLWVSRFFLLTHRWGRPPPRVRAAPGARARCRSNEPERAAGGCVPSAARSDG